jgi:hypothetical protein
VDKKKKGRDPAFARRDAILNHLIHPWHWRYLGNASGGDEDDESERRSLSNLDPRWLDVAVKLENVELVQTLARPGHPQANKLLESAFAEMLKKSSDAHTAVGILATMVKVEHPAATDAFLSLLQKSSKETHWGWFTYWIGPLIPELPKEALPRIEEALPQLPEKAIDQWLEHVQALKAKP